MNKSVKAIELSGNVRRWNPERGLQMQSHFRDTTLGVPIADLERIMELVLETNLPNLYYRGKDSSFARSFDPIIESPPSSRRWWGVNKPSVSLLMLGT
jgi:hypothetical protein